MSAIAADLFRACLAVKPNSILGLATGSTALGTYKKLISLYQSGEISFSQVKTFNLDEYAGLSEENDQSYRYYMNKNLFEHIDIDMKNTHLPNGMAADLAQECLRYNELIGKLGGADIQLLGLGLNGHIGFNEPDDYFAKETRAVDLDESTIQANARFFANEREVPRKAITIGISNIMQAETVILCVSGVEKAAILAEVIAGQITPRVPGSVLQLHRDCIVVADEAALRIV